jgi:hypothetical protein
MRILVATPFMSSHYDAGLFFVKALANRGHSIYLWDYRIQKEMPQVEADCSIVFKGETVDPSKLPRPAINYFPDWFERFHPSLLDRLAKYDRVFTPVIPTPASMTWLPSGWDPMIHRNLGLPRSHDIMYIGTANSEYKVAMVKKLDIYFVYGNGWKEHGVVAKPPVYLHELVETANRAKVLIDIHQSPTIGFNRKGFEMVACGPTIFDNVPGMIEVLGEDLASEVCFGSPDMGKIKLRFLLADEKRRNELWEREKKAIQPYTYERCLDRMLDFV